MIIKILKENKKSYKYLFRCDACEKEFKRKYTKSKLGKNQLGRHQFCSYNCFSKWFRGKNHSQWKNGRTKTTLGYILINNPEHPFADSNGYIYEHRLVMEKKLGRYLKLDERVHHINGIKDDNRIENLKLYKNIVLHFIETIILKNKGIICPYCNKKFGIEDIT